MAAVMHMDNRVRSHMSADVLMTHMRLEAWGRWAKDKAQAWPTRTILGRMIEEGPGAGQETGSSGEIPEAAQQTDRAVAHLGDLDGQRVGAGKFGPQSELWAHWPEAQK